MFSDAVLEAIGIGNKWDDQLLAKERSDMDVLLPIPRSAGEEKGAA